MRDAWAKTFEHLATSKHPGAVSLLLAAVGAEHSKISAAGVQALLGRNDVAAHVEIVRLHKSLGYEAVEVIQAKATVLDAALERCLVKGDQELKLAALELIVTAECYKSFPVMLSLLEGPGAGLFEKVAQTLSELTNRLYEHCEYAKDGKANERHLPQAANVRQKVIGALDQACAKLTVLKHPDVVVESLLVLGDAAHYAVKKALSQTNPGCRELASRLFLESDHPGIMSLVLDDLSQGYSHRMSFEALERRSDPQFVCHLLRSFPKQLNENLQKNLKQVSHIAWLTNPDQLIDLIPNGLHAPLVNLVAAIGLPEGQKNKIYDWILHHAGPEARLLAANLMAYSDEATAQEIIFEGLDSQDPGVQAWATSQLRARAIPEAFSLLIGKLDSDLDAVKQAAREELESFNVRFILKVYEHLDPQVCQRAGALVEKVDPEGVKRLEQELTSPVRNNRIRAAKAVKALGLHPQMVRAVFALAGDEDALIRRTVGEMLADIPIPEALDLLYRLLEDTSPRVQEAAAASIDQQRKRQHKNSRLAAAQSQSR